MFSFKKYKYKYEFIFLFYFCNNIGLINVVKFLLNKYVNNLKSTENLLLAPIISIQKACFLNSVYS